MKSPAGSVEIKIFTTNELSFLYCSPTTSFSTITVIQELYSPPAGYTFTASEASMLFDQPGFSGYFSLLFLPYMGPGDITGFQLNPAIA